jgi:hypothetical protein
MIKKYFCMYIISHWNFKTKKYMFRNNLLNISIVSMNLSFVQKYLFKNNVLFLQNWFKIVYYYWDTDEMRIRENQ